MTGSLPLATALSTFLAAVALTTALATVAAAGSVSTAALLVAPGSTATAAVATTAATVTSTLASIAAATASATVSSVASSAAAATTTATGAVRCLVDADGTSVKLDVVHVLHCIVGLGVLGEAHETESTATASIAVLNDDGFLNLAEFLELLAQSLVVGMPCKATNEEFGHVGQTYQFDLADSLRVSKRLRIRGRCKG